MLFSHYSRNLYDRDPQGAAPCGSHVLLSADADGDILSASIRWYTAAGTAVIPMNRDSGRFSACVTAPDTPQLAYYDFLLETTKGTRFAGSYSGQCRLTEREDERYPLTVYARVFATPQWFCEGIVYQIFPDRFCRGDFARFSATAEERNVSGRRVRLHRDWSEAPEYLPATGELAYVPDDYFGGDLLGIRNKLPYLKHLGVTCLYLNPIFEAYSNHRYNTADYRSIDRLLGTREDFVGLCRDAQDMGIRLILDGVFSHTGDDSLYFNRYARFSGRGACQGSDSPYYPWYTFHAFPDQYSCWWNFPTLPNVNEREPSYRAFICGKDGVLAQWLRDGASGWRLDVADELPDDFIRSVRERVKAEHPDAVLIGEVWDDCSDKQGPEGRRGYVDGDLLDCAMNYPFRRATLDYLCGRGDAYAYNETLQRLREHYPKPFYDAMLNLISSHDEVRALTELAGAPNRYTASRDEQACFRPDADTIEQAKKRFLCATALQMLLPGVPCVYYGDEAGLTGMNDPFNRTTYPWGCEDAALLQQVSGLIHCRRHSQALMAGHARFGAVSGDIFAVIRYTDTEVVLGLVNRSGERKRALLQPDLLYEGPDGRTPVPFAGTYRDMDGRTCQVNTMLETMLPPYGYQIFRKEK